MNNLENSGNKNCKEVTKKIVLQNSSRIHEACKKNNLKILDISNENFKEINFFLFNCRNVLRKNKYFRVSEKNKKYQTYFRVTRGNKLIFRRFNNFSLPHTVICVSKILKKETKVVNKANGLIIGITTGILTLAIGLLFFVYKKKVTYLR